MSALWACADEETQQALQKAQFAAVQETCRHIEEQYSLTRRGKGGAIKENAYLVVATFEHGTSRAQDPQLHTHCLVLNLAVRADGTTGALESKPFYNAKMVAGAYYRAELAHQLEEMGFRVERTKNRTFEVKGIPRTLTDTFSQRRAEIRTALAESGETGARAAAKATLRTRTVKEHAPRKELFGKWRVTGAAHGVTEQTVQELKVGIKTHESPSAEHEKEKLRTALRESITIGIGRVTSDKSHFSEKELLRAVLEEAPGRGVWSSLTHTAVRHELTKTESIIPLGEVRGEKQYTTRELLLAEQIKVQDREIAARMHKAREQTTARTSPDQQASRAPVPEVPQPNQSHYVSHTR